MAATWLWKNAFERMIHQLLLSPHGLFRNLRLLAGTHFKAACRWLACYLSQLVHTWHFILPRIVKASNSDQQEDKSSTIKVNFCCTKVSVHDGTIIQSAASNELISNHTAHFFLYQECKYARPPPLLYCMEAANQGNLQICPVTIVSP